MPLSVSYKNRIGYYTLKQGKDKWKIWICHANALCAFMYFYKDEHGKDMAQLMGFACDIQHVKNLIKNDWFTPCSNFHFFAKEMDAELWKMVKLLAEAGIKVTVE